MNKKSFRITSVKNQSLLARNLLNSLDIPRGWKAEVYYESNQYREVGWAEQKPKDTMSGVSCGVSVRALREGQMGLAYGSDLTKEGIQRLWEQSREKASYMPEDRHYRFLKKRKNLSGRNKMQIDKNLFLKNINVLEKTLSGYEKKILRYDRRVKKVLRLSIKESKGAYSLANTSGLAVQESYGSVSFDIELMGKMNNDVQTSWDYTQTRSWKDLNIQKAIGDTLDRLVRSFGARVIPSKQYPIVFTPRVGVDFLEFLSDSFCGDMVQKGQSFLGKKKGKKVASSLVTLIDDGRLKGGLASSCFDDEGVPTGKHILLKKGVLKQFLYDSYSAAKEKKLSTGNANRSGIQGVPSPGISNFYMMPGKTDPRKIMGASSSVFVLHDVLGMHTADSVSGDFSVGASGLLYEKGKIQQAVKGVTLAGNLLELISKIDRVGNDLSWYGNIGCPTFRVSGLSVGGS